MSLALTFKKSNNMNNNNMHEEAMGIIVNEVKQMLERIDQYEDEKDDGDNPENVIARLESGLYRIKRWLPQEG